VVARPGAGPRRGGGAASGADRERPRPRAGVDAGDSSRWPYRRPPPERCRPAGTSSGPSSRAERCSDVQPRPYAPSPSGSTRRRNDRIARWCASDSRCSSQAVQTFSRSGVWSRGLFHTSRQAAGRRQPLAEQMTGSACGVTEAVSSPCSRFCQGRVRASVQSSPPDPGRGRRTPGRGVGSAGGGPDDRTTDRVGTGGGRPPARRGGPGTALGSPPPSAAPDDGSRAPRPPRREREPTGRNAVQHRRVRRLGSAAWVTTGDLAGR
jgi:hypothetical protein